MLVHELIAELSKLPPHATVVVRDNAYDLDGYVNVQADRMWVKYGMFYPRPFDPQDAPLVDIVLIDAG